MNLSSFKIPFSEGLTFKGRNKNLKGCEDMPLNSGTEENWSKSLEKTFSVYRNSTEEHMRMTAGVFAL